VTYVNALTLSLPVVVLVTFELADAAPPAPPFPVPAEMPPPRPPVARAVPLIVCEPVIVSDAEAVPPAVAFEVPVALPPLPPVAVLVAVKELACWGLAVLSLKVRLDVPDPAGPAAPFPDVTVPPSPPLAVCDKVSVLPVVEPVTALVSVLDAPAPAFAPPPALPPLPPLCVTVAVADVPDAEAVVPPATPPAPA
jgi:hypothetical protein